MALKVLVIGESNLDLILFNRSGTLPEIGKEILIDDYLLTLGSSSAIFACGFAKLSGQPIFVSKVGKDAFGKLFVAELKRKGVNTSWIKIVDNLRTGLTVSFSGPCDRALVTFPGTIAEMTINDIPKGVFNKAKHLHMAAYFLQRRLRPAVAKIFRMAKEAGLSISFDPGCDPEGKWDIKDTLKYVDILFLNEVEAGYIKIKNVSKKMITVIKRGKEGAEMIVNGKKYLARPPAGIKVVDTTGAGDSFDAGFVYGFLKGFPCDYSLRFACVAGTLSTRGLGGTTTQPTEQEVRKFCR